MRVLFVEIMIVYYEHHTKHAYKYLGKKFRMLRTQEKRL